MECIYISWMTQAEFTHGTLKVVCFMHILRKLWKLKSHTPPPLVISDVTRPPSTVGLSEHTGTTWKEEYMRARARTHTHTHTHTHSLSLSLSLSHTHTHRHTHPFQDTARHTQEKPRSSGCQLPDQRVRHACDQASAWTPQRLQDTPESLNWPNQRFHCLPS
jgi:hypothetical protein